MADDRTAELADDIREFLAASSGWNKSAAELTDDHPLIEDGVLDSLGLLSLVQFLEERLSTAIDNEAILPENFGSIERICSFVGSLPKA